jgi:hypothetical protein
LKLQMKLIMKNDYRNLNIIVVPTETVGEMKAKVLSSQLIPFTGAQLVIDGHVRQEEDRLGDCHITPTSQLSMTVQATESHLCQQFAELLKSRHLSIDELSLLYAYKHSVNVKHALKIIGYDGGLKEFVQGMKQCHLAIEGNYVALVQESSALKPFCLFEEINLILQNGPLDIKYVKKAFVDKFGTNIGSIANSRPLDFFLKHDETYYVDGRVIYLRKHWDESEQAPPGLESQGEMQATEKKFLQLHEEICSEINGMKMNDLFDDALNTIKDEIFLDVSHVVKLSSHGKGTCIVGDSHLGDALFCVENLPQQKEALQKSVRSALLLQNADIDLVEVVQDRFEVQMYRHTFSFTLVPVLDNLPRNAGKVMIFESERILFVAKQPECIKKTIRLLKWWRNQQTWRSQQARPCDFILELIAIYSAIKTKPDNQHAAIANVMQFLSQFASLRIVWSNYYKVDAINCRMLERRPLLLDPVDATIDVVQETGFDSAQLMHYASCTSFFR